MMRIPWNQHLSHGKLEKLNATWHARPPERETRCSSTEAFDAAAAELAEICGASLETAREALKLANGEARFARTLLELYGVTGFWTSQRELFAIAGGLSAESVARHAGLRVEQAQAMIDAYKRTHPEPWAMQSGRVTVGATEDGTAYLDEVDRYPTGRGPRDAAFFKGRSVGPTTGVLEDSWAYFDEAIADAAKGRRVTTIQDAVFIDETEPEAES